MSALATPGISLPCHCRCCWSVHPKNSTTREGFGGRAVTPCSENLCNCGVDRAQVDMESGDLVGDWHLLLIRHARSSRQAARAKHPWQLIGGSSCQVPLGQCLPLRLLYLFHFQMHLSVLWRIFDKAEQPTRDASHEPTAPRNPNLVRIKILFSFPFSGTRWKARPQRTERPDGRHPRWVAAQHASMLMIYPAQISPPLFRFT